jgi:hypothetical protein
LISVVWITTAIFGLSLSKNASTFQRRALWLAFAGLVAEFIFYGFLSTIYDFHDCFYPSRGYPYFTSGRLLLGALIPSLLLLVFGLDYALKQFGNVTKFSALTLWVLFMLASEVVTDWPVFFSRYNWYHM